MLIFATSSLQASDSGGIVSPSAPAGKAFHGGPVRNAGRTRDNGPTPSCRRTPGGRHGRGSPPAWCGTGRDPARRAGRASAPRRRRGRTPLPSALPVGTRRGHPRRPCPARRTGAGAIGRAAASPPPARSRATPAFRPSGRWAPPAARTRPVRHVPADSPFRAAPCRRARPRAQSRHTAGNRRGSSSSDPRSHAAASAVPTVAAAEPGHPSAVCPAAMEHSVAITCARQAARPWHGS